MFSFYKCTSPCLMEHNSVSLGICADRTEVYIKEIWVSKFVGRKDPKDLDLL